VSKLDDFHKLAADIFSPEELEYCKGIIPDSQEIEKLVKSISEQTAVADTFILPKITDKQLSSDIGKSDLDPLFDVVSEWAKPKKQVSIDQIQRKFAVGYIRADRILEQLKVTGIVK
jgi:DNA segregation ATPase FtsK/SpoIIIE-like protein